MIVAEKILQLEVVYHGKQLNKYKILAFPPIMVKVFYVRKRGLSKIYLCRSNIVPTSRTKKYQQ